MPWTKIPSISPAQEFATIVGDRAKPGLYIQLVRWKGETHQMPEKIAKANIEHFKKLLETKTDAKKARYDRASVGRGRAKTCGAQEEAQRAKKD
jgi:hypothetical protein